MNNQHGSTLVVSLVLLTIITLVAMYALEGSSIQSKIVASSLFSTLTHQECRNDQEADVRFFNDNGGAARALLLNTITTNAPYPAPGTRTRTELYVTNAPRSDLDVSWVYIKDAPSSRSGFNVDTEAQSIARIFEGNCSAVFRFSNNSQTLGTVVEGLRQAGNIK